MRERQKCTIWVGGGDREERGETLPESVNMPVNHERGMWGGGGLLQTGICSREDRKKGGSGTQWQSAIHTHMRTHMHTHTLCVSSVSLFQTCQSTSQSIIFVCVCVFSGDVERSSWPSFSSMTDGKIVSLTLTARVSRRLLYFCLLSFGFFLPCVFLL